MNIKLRILYNIATLEALRDSSQFGGSFNEDAYFELDSDSDAFNLILEATRNTSGSRFIPIMSFTPSELSKVRYFQPECRHMARERERDNEQNAKRMEDREFLDTGPGVGIKLLDRIVLSHISSKSNVISCVGHGTEEFILGEDVAQAFRQARLTGFSLLPVYHSKTDQAHEGYHHLYSENIMPSAERDITIFRVPDPDPRAGHKRLACLTYDLAKVNVPADINRTAENWAANYFPLWVISARVKECYERNKLRGWAFRPVLEKGSELHAKYLEKWTDLFARISVNPHNRF